MGATGTGADGLQVFLTGASVTAALQADPADSLGGYHGDTRADSLTVTRTTPMSGVTIDFVAGKCEPGICQITAVTVDSLAFTAPGESQGDAVEIANGETHVLASDTASCYAIVTRTSADDLGGAETFQVLDTYSNVIGGTDFTSAEAVAGEEKFRAVMFVNNPGIDTPVSVWLDPDNEAELRIASETPSGAGAIQTIADEETAPSGLSWVSPTTEGTALSLGSIPHSGGRMGLWIEQSVDPGETCTAKRLGVIHYKATIGGVDYYGELRGVCRVANASAEQWQLFDGVDEEPDISGTPDATFTSSPYDYALSAGHTHYLRICKQNQYGIRSGAEASKILVIESDGSSLGTPPSNPTHYQIDAYTAGAVRAQALYCPQSDAVEDRADTWAIYLTDDDTTPDPDSDTPSVVDMRSASTRFGGQQEVLDQTSAGTYLEDQPIKALIRTRRAGTPATESVNTDVVSATVEYFGPTRPRVDVSLGRAWGVAQAPTAPPADVVTYVDAAKNVRWIQSDGMTKLYNDTDLVLCVRANSLRSDWGGIRTPYGIVSAAVSGAGSTDPVEVGQWDGAAKILYVTVNGVRRMEIDCVAETIKVDAIYAPASPSTTLSTEPCWRKWAHTCLQVWDAGSGEWTTAAAVDSAGLLTVADGIVGALDVATCISESA